MKSILLVFLLLAGCTTHIPVPQQSPEVSKIAYAIKDSFDSSRIDLADEYTNQLSYLIVPPASKIQISPIIKDGKRTVILPEKFKDKNVVVVGTKEWDDLLKIKDIASQLAEDKSNLTEQLNSVQEELRKQNELKTQLIQDNADLKSEVDAVKAKLFKRTVYLVGLVLLVGAYFYIKIKGIFPLPI